MRPDDGAVLLAVRDASTYRVLQFPPDGAGEPRLILTLLSRPWIDASPDRALYVSLMERPGEVLRFGAAGGAVEPLATNADISGGAIALGDGRALLGARAGSGDRVLIAAPGKEPIAIADTDEDTRMPLTSLGQGRAALLIGRGAAPDIAIVAVDIAGGWLLT